MIVFVCHFKIKFDFAVSENVLALTSYCYKAIKIPTNAAKSETFALDLFAHCQIEYTFHAPKGILTIISEVTNNRRD